jgi:hypothetical protein
MGVPSDQLMQMIKSQRDGATPAGIPPAPQGTTGMSDTSAAPMASPMSTAEPKMGNREAAMINLAMAMDLLEQALPALGSETPEGQKVLGAIRTMTSVIGPKKAKTNELQPAEIMQMLQTLPQAGGATAEGKAMQQAPQIPGMSAPTPPPAMPGGMPGGAPSATPQM